MKQDLTEDELRILDELWRIDISVGGAPEGWDYEYFQKKIEGKMYDQFSFRTSVMKVLSEVPRDNEKPKTPKEITVERLQNELRSSWKAKKLADAIEWAKKNPVDPPVVTDWR